MKVDIFIPCFVDQLFPQTAFNMDKVLEKVGCEVNYNPEQTCCGQPAFNAGHWDIAKEIGEKFINEFKGDRYIVSPSASCVGMVKNYYPELFNNSSVHNQCNTVRKNMFELSDFLVNVLKVSDIGATLNGLATYHDSCAGLRECGIKKEPRQLLEKVRGLELKEMEGTETCCGFGGLFAVKFEAISVSLAEQKVEYAMKTGAKYLISTDLSCLMHMDGYIKKNNLPLEVKHLADVLAEGWE
jgi:L-lactate dehydrogenase complex protein LldE